MKLALDSLAHSLHNPANPTPPAHNALDDMCVCDFAADTASRIHLSFVVVFAVTISQLRHQAIDFFLRRWLDTRTQQTSEVIDVAAGKTEERFGFYMSNR